MFSKSLSNKKAEKLGDAIMEMISKIRLFKTSNKKSMKEPVVLTLDTKKYKLALDDIKAAVNAREIINGSFKVEF